MNVGGVITGQERHRGSHLLRRAHPPGRQPVEHRLDVVNEFLLPLGRRARQEPELRPAAGRPDRGNQFIAALGIPAADQTCAPSSASLRAIATPRPPVEPVTSAARPANRVSSGLMSPHASPDKMDLQVQKLTSKGQATRARIIDGAAAEIRQRGVAQTTIDDVMARTRTSKSQIFHYFPHGKDQLLLAVATLESQRVLDDQQPHLSSLTSWAAWQRWRDVVIERYRRQGQNCPIAVLMSEIGRTSTGAQAVTTELIDSWRSAIAEGIAAMQQQDKIARAVDPERAAAALLAGIQGGVGIMLATGDLTYLEAALDERISALRQR